MDKKRILIIDDEVDFCKIVKMNLEQLGDFSVDIALNGIEGIELAEKTKPLLILLDIRMRDMDGFQVLKRLKNNESTMSIPVVMLTALGDDVSKARAAELYNNGYITKPIDTQALKVKIEEVFKRSH